MLSDNNSATLQDVIIEQTAKCLRYRWLEAPHVESDADLQNQIARFINVTPGLGCLNRVWLFNEERAAAEFGP